MCRDLPPLPRSLLLAALTVALLTACLPSEDGIEVPLHDSSHQPDVLTEARALDFPPEPSGNRFLRGWRLRRQGQPSLAPLPRDGGSRLELVNLAPRPRKLVLYADLEDLPENVAVEVEAAGRPLGTLALQNPLTLELPTDLPLGRVSVDLRFPEEGTIRVRKAALEPALPTGEVDIEGEEIQQKGDSLVDFVRWIEAPTTLVGSFRPPRRAADDHRYRLIVEHAPGAADDPLAPIFSETAFEWNPGFLDRLRGEQHFEVPLPVGPGPVRIRLHAEGVGDAGRWSLRLRFPPAAEDSSPEPEALPRPKLVLLYVLDALRADYMGHLGGPEGVSPHFDQLAAQGATFARHLSVAPNTLPSSMSLFTGQIFLDLPQGRWKLASDGPQTLGEVFREAGYETAIFAANGYLSEAFGTTRGFDVEGRDAIYGPLSPIQPYNDSAERVHRATLEWLENRNAERPAFLYVHTLNPHNPYDPPPEDRQLFVESESELDGSTEALRAMKQFKVDVGPEDEEHLRELYAASMAYNDRQFETFLQAIEARYEPGEVLILVTSDHGDEFFEHGGVLHGYTLYDEQLAIPLIFHWPGVIEPGRLNAATDNLDLHETLRSLVGAPPSDRGNGRSLWPLLRSADAREEGGKGVRFAVASSVAGGMYMAQSDRGKLVWAPRVGAGWGMGEGRGRTRDPEYFFDLTRDPGEHHNQVGSPSLEQALLRARLLAWIEKSRAIEEGTTEDGGELDEETRKHLEALGYLD